MEILKNLRKEELLSGRWIITKQIMKGTFKKAAALALAAIGMLGAMSTVSAEEEITLNLAHIYVNESDGQAIGFKRALDAYKEAHPNVTVVEDTADNDAYKTKLKTQLAAGSVPDVFCAWGGGFTAPFVDAGIVANLDAYVENGTINMDAMLPGICNNFYYNDSLYGLPLDSFIGVLMCNQELFDTYGVTVPTTMEEMYAAAEVFIENGITPIAMGEKDKWPGLFPFGVIALRYGGVETTTALLNGEGNFDQEFVVQSAQELQKMVELGVFADDSVALTNDEAIEEFKQGRAAMWYSGNWQVGDLSTNSPLAGKLTLVNWPAIDGAAGDQNAFVGGASACLVVSESSEHKDAAVELAAFMSQYFSDYAYEEGAILPTWKYEGEMELQPFQERLLELMNSADGFCLAWDTLLDPEPADVHSTSLQGIYAKQMTADDYISAMVATR